MTRSDATAAGDLALGGDLPVRRMGFGAMRLPVGAAGWHGDPRPPAEGMAVLRRAVELGVNHVDTAAFYGHRDVYANDLIREALAPYPGDLVIATKVGPVRDGDVGPPTRSATADELRGLVEADLERLGVDRLDLVYLRVGLMEPTGESIGERFEVLAGLREEGLIRHLGVSNVTLGPLQEALRIAPVAAVQNHFHVRHRADAAMLERCAELGIAYAPFFPIGGGNRPIEADRVAKVAARYGATPVQVALAALLGTSPVMLAIPGTGDLGHLEENVAAAGLRLDEADLAELAG